MDKTLEQKYRFIFMHLGEHYVHVFESRYFAEKYLNEVVLKEERYTPGVFQYEIKLEKYGYVIYEKQVFVL